MTEAEIELGMKAAKMFTPKPWKCIREVPIQQSNLDRCNGCEYRLAYNDIPEECTVPDPIDINDWNVAHKLMAQVDGDVFMQELSRIGTSTTMKWTPTACLLLATPSDYTKAAIRAKEAENETN